MKKSMPEYINVLSDGDYNVLEEIFQDKYKKFLELYWLICNFSDYITGLRYKHTEKDILKIEMNVTKIDTSYALTEISEKIKDPSMISVWNEGKIIHIEITKKESVPA